MFSQVNIPFEMFYKIPALNMRMMHIFNHIHRINQSFANNDNWEIKFSLNIQFLSTYTFDFIKKVGRCNVELAYFVLSNKSLLNILMLAPVSIRPCVFLLSIFTSIVFVWRGGVNPIFAQS